MGTLLLSNSDVKKLLEIPQLFPWIKKGFQAYSLSKSSVPVERFRCALPQSPNSSVVVLFPGILQEIPAYSVKVHAKLPGQQPAIKGIIHLHDLNTGELLAMMDSTYITAVRTGLSGALGTHLLADKNADTVTIVGAGAQGELQLKSLLYFRRIKRVWVCDVDVEQAHRFSKRLEQELGLPITVAKTLEDSLANSKIIITATWSRAPFIFPDMIKPGTHITTIGPDEPGKSEVSAEVIRQALFVCDSRELAVDMEAIGGVGLDAESIAAEIGEILNGKHQGRTDPAEITVYGAVGLAFQDLAAAWVTYQKAKEVHLGLEFDFLK